MNGLRWLQRQQAAKGIKGAYVFVNERGHPFGRMGIGRMIERAGEAAKLRFPVHVHVLRHSTGYARAAKGMDTRQLQHFLGHASITNTVRYTAMSPEPFKDIWRETQLQSSLAGGNPPQVGIAGDGVVMPALVAAAPPGVP